jgi:type VI secretion system protein VasJ
MDEFEAIAGDVLKPIAGSNPAGLDARHDAEHESLRAELEKLNSMAKASISWAEVDRLATNILQNKSKDVLAATYGAAAWMELNGAPGLLRGIGTVGGIFARFPEGAFPSRARARANAVAWFLDRATAWISREDVNGLDHDGLRALASLIRHTASATQTALGADCPSFTSLERAIGRRALSVPAVPAAAPQESDAAVTVPAPPPPPSQSEPSPFVSAAQPEPHSSESAERARAATWLGPLPGDARCGVDLAYDDAFAELQSQIGRLESPTADPPDWKRVRAIAEELLRSRSKDLFVASYLTAALLELEGIAGLTVGTWLLSDLCERFWDDMWPSAARLRRRASALSWFVARASARAPQLASQAPAAELAQFEAALQALTSTLPRFGNDAPNLRAFREFVEQRRTALARNVVTAPPPAPPPPAPVAAPETQAPPPRPPAQVALPEAPADAPAEAAQVAPFLRSLGERLVQTARLLRTANNADPAAYRLLRQGVWLHIDKAPPRDAEKRTRIPAPQKRVADSLASLAAGEKWESLLTQAEGTVPTSPLWLDLHWYAAKALRGLGAGHEAAREALERETRAFVERLPELVDASFQDGSPLAGPEARSWLRPAAAQSIQTGPSQGDSSPAGLSAENQALVAAGTRDGLAKVQQEIGAHRAERVRFLCRLDLARGLATSGRAIQALAVYRGLAADVEHHGLERWEPDLATQALTAYWECLKTHESPQGVVSDEGRSLCAKLARLAPEALI